MGMFSGVSKAIKNVGKAVEKGFESIGDFGQDVIDFGGDVVKGIGKAGEQTVKNIPSMLQSGVDLSRLALGGGSALVGTVLTNPTDPSRWEKKLRGIGSEFDDIGADLFGSGGWASAAANFLSAGNPFYGAGSTLARLYEGDNYEGGSTSPVGTLLGAYNLGQSLYNGFSGDVPAGEEGLNLVDGQGATGAEAFGETSYMNQPLDSFYDPGALTQEFMPNWQDQLSAGFDPTSLLGEDTSSFFDQFSNIYNSVSGVINSPMGKLGLTALSKNNPQIAAALSLGAAGGEGGGLAQAMEAAQTLEQLYRHKKTRKYLEGGLNDLYSARDQALGLYAPGSAYAEQLRKTMERQDAAAGRRSQYGTRETELAARLAEKQAGVLNNYSSQLANYEQTRKALAQSSGLNAGSMAEIAMKNLPGLYKQGSEVAKSLADYFRG